MDPARRDELLDFIRKNMDSSPWPLINKTLAEKGFTNEEVDAAVDELFPGETRRREKKRVWAGLIGATVGMAIWFALAVFYRMTHHP